MSVRTCKLWRYLPGKPGANTRPGGSADSWRPCREPVANGVTGCADCFEAVIQHPDPQVRIAVTAHADTPADVLEVLALDGDQRVSIAATSTLQRRTPAGTASTLPSPPLSRGASRP